MPVGIEVKVHDKEVRDLLADLAGRMGDLRPVMRVIGETMHTSIQRNFEKGGRPRSWKRLAPATIAQRKKEGKWPGRILVRKGTSGGLLGTLKYRPFSNKVVVRANKIYAAIHHFGGRAGRGHKVLIPARPYMMIQDEDLVEINKALSDYVLLGRAR